MRLATVRKVQAKSARRAACREPQQSRPTRSAVYSVGRSQLPKMSPKSEFSRPDGVKSADACVSGADVPQLATDEKS